MFFSSPFVMGCGIFVFPFTSYLTPFWSSYPLSRSLSFHPFNENFCLLFNIIYIYMLYGQIGETKVLRSKGNPHNNSYQPCNLFSLHLMLVVALYYSMSDHYFIQQKQRTFSLTNHEHFHSNATLSRKRNLYSLKKN